MAKIIPIHAFQDNYIWLIEDQGIALIVDPGDAKPVIEYLQEHNLKLTAIFVTHHHFDHSGGVGDLLATFGPIPVYGGHNEPIEHLTHPMKENDLITLKNLNLQFKVLEIPGHTRGHVAFVADKFVFTGDTLFTAGCGRLFEGSAEQMWQSLTKLKKLPIETLIYCGHEYTAQNLKFASLVEPQNTQIKKRILEIENLRQKNLPTVPSGLKLELETNPFLRTHINEVKMAASAHCHQPLKNEIEIFSVLREWKNNFQG